MAGEVLKFGPFVFDRRRKLLSTGGMPMSVGARALALLDALLKADGHVVTRAELMDAAWPATSIEESNLTVQIAALRKRLSDLSDGEEWIKTVPRVGYRFEGPIQIDTNAKDTQPDDEREQPPPDDISIAVLPFRQLGKDTEQASFAEGLSEDLITELSKVPGVTVIARYSSFAYRGQGIDLRTIGSDLGVKYIIEGSVRRDGKRVRINAELSDATAARQIWADRFDGDIGDVFTLQDDIVGRIASALAVTIPNGHMTPRSRIGSFDAHDHFVRGRTLVMESMEGNRAARPLLQAAVDIDPNFAAAHAWLAMSHYGAWSMWGESLELHRTPALEAAKRATVLDPKSADARMILGYIHTYEGDLSLGDMEFGEALRLNLNHADAFALMADLRVFQHKAEQGVESIERAFRLNPYPPRVYYWVLGFSYYAARRYDEAIAALKHAYRNGSQRLLAASLAQLGRVEEANAEAALFLSNNPDFKIRRWAETHPFQNLDDREHFVEGYLKAGLPFD